VDVGSRMVSFCPGMDADDSSYLASPEDRAAHDERVLALINDTLRTHSAHYQNYTVSLILDACNGALTIMRDVDVMNTEVRDAEYYFIARSRVASHKWKLAKDYSQDLWTSLADVYDWLKGGTNATNEKRGSHLLQSQDHKPNSPPGGARWARQGAFDGQFDDPNAVAVPRLCSYTPAAYEELGGKYVFSTSPQA
jgi:hypothetical protein